MNVHKRHLLPLTLLPILRTYRCSYCSTAYISNRKKPQTKSNDFWSPCNSQMPPEPSMVPMKRRENAKIVKQQHASIHTETLNPRNGRLQKIRNMPSRATTSYLAVDLGLILAPVPPHHAGRVLRIRHTQCRATPQTNVHTQKTQS